MTNADLLRKIKGVLETKQAVNWNKARVKKGNESRFFEGMAWGNQEAIEAIEEIAEEVEG
jgi:hypothetical protein